MNQTEEQLYAAVCSELLTFGFKQKEEFSSRTRTPNLIQTTPGLFDPKEEEGVLMLMSLYAQSPDLNPAQHAEKPSKNKVQNMQSHHETVCLKCSKDNRNNVNYFNNECKL